ncbi:MAG: TIGR03960 family B12-binding radical SAM protein [Bacillota bacterium]
MGSGQNNVQKPIDIDRYNILAKVQKPAQYIGKEYNSVIKDWHKTEVKMAFLFPDTYEIGMSYLGLRVLYEAVNRDERFLLERSFAPMADMEALMRERNIPLFTWESRHAVADFDVVGFTLQYELSYSNVLNMLDLAGIPQLAVERQDGPLVIAGGPCAFNPEPLADFIDIFIIGEGEEVLLELLTLIAESRQKGLTKAEFMHQALSIKGLYMPKYYDVSYQDNGKIASIVAKSPAPPKVCKRFLSDLDQAPFPRAAMLPHTQVVHDRAMLELMRGCTRGCRFCQAGIIYRPLREKSLELLLEQGKEQLLSSGYEEVGLVSLSSADYSCIDRLVDGLLQENCVRGVGVSLPSLRVDAFSVDLARRVQQVRKSGLTFAPEAGSQRLRDIINKGVTEEDIIAAVSAAFAAGWTNIKLYFMIGLPEETEEDLAAIVDLCQKVLSTGRRLKPKEIKKPIKITLGVASFVPKAHTPFQWQGQNSPELLRHKQAWLREKLRPLRQVHLNCHDIETSALEAVFSRGDRRLGQVLLQAWQNGCRFDGWSEHFRPDIWQKAFDACGVDRTFYANTVYEKNDILPWSHISCGVERDWLWQEYQKAKAGVLTDDCRHEVCSGCGICRNLSGHNIFAT